MEDAGLLLFSQFILPPTKKGAIVHFSLSIVTQDTEVTMVNKVGSWQVLDDGGGVESPAEIEGIVGGSLLYSTVMRSGKKNAVYNGVRKKQPKKGHAGLAINEPSDKYSQAIWSNEISIWSMGPVVEQTHQPSMGVNISLQSSKNSIQDLCQNLVSSGLLWLALLTYMLQENSQAC